MGPVIGGGGGGGGGGASGEYSKAYVDAADQANATAIGNKQDKSVNLTTLAGIVPGAGVGGGKAILAAADAAAARALIGAQPASTAISYRVGQMEEFPILNAPTLADGWMPADGITLRTIADDPRYPALVAALGLGAAVMPDTVTKDGINYSSPSRLSPLVYIGGKWIYYPQTGSSSVFPRSSPDLNVWTAGGQNIYTLLNSSLGMGVMFNGKVYLFNTNGSAFGFISSADGLTNWSAFVNLTTQFNVAAGSAGYLYINSVRVLDNKLWIAGSVGGNASTSQSFIASMAADGTWTRAATGSYMRPLNDICRKPAGTILAPSYNGEVLCSDDEGATWTSYATGVTEQLTASVWDATHATFVIGGNSGRVVYTVSGKANFVKGSISGFISTINDLQVVNGTVIAACTGNGLDGRGRLHYSRDLADWTFKMPGGIESITSVYRIAYNAGIYAFLVNSPGGSNTNGIIANSAPAFDPATQFYVPKGNPTLAGYAVYVRIG